MSEAGQIIPGLMVLHGNRAEVLRDVLVAWMRRHPLAPLENEVVLVQSNGIAQWLRLALAAEPQTHGGGCGIAAALDLLLPSRFIWQAYRTVLGADAVPEHSPFDKPRLTWRLMRLLPMLAAQEIHAPLRRFLADDADMRKRHQLAVRLADLFDQYQVYRADWLAAWAQGDDVLPDARGQRPPVPEEQGWQPALWRALIADVGEDGAASGRAAVHARFLEAAAHPDTARPALPRRVMVFGISALPRQTVDVLAALARWSQVVLCVHNPCEHYWADIVTERDWLRRERARQRRKPGMPEVLAEESLHFHAQPLLAAWGRQGRDFIAMLDDYDTAAERERHAPRLGDMALRLDSFESPGEATVLAQLQDDIRDLRPLSETRARWPAVDPAHDDSIRFHIAHHAQREVEILHDALLAAFDADPELQPRDVIVMVPDIEAYTPHIQAVFGLPGRDDARHIPYCIADRGPRHHDPVLVVVERLLDLPEARLSLPDVLDLLDVEAVRRRFGIHEHDVPLLARWAADAGVRWGLDAAHRERLDLPAMDEQNTWAFGLRRLLFGYAVGDSALEDWNGIEPHPEVGGLEAALLGALADLVDALEHHAVIMATPATPAQWGERIRALLADFFLADEAEELRSLQRLEEILQEWLEHCEAAAFDEAVPLAVVREHGLDALADGGLSQRFFAGAVTFATLMPMRAIPFRQVCLLGMNDGDYPRARQPMDFDLMAGAYRPGDRSRREDDCYLFLEALLSARARLHLSWVGRSVQDNSPRPPSVLVAQLREHLAAGWRCAGREEEDGQALLDALTVEHPLQPFSPRYFTASNEAGLFTYAREWRAAAHGAARAAPAALLPLWLPDEALSLDTLARFVARPVEGFFKQRLGVYFNNDELTADADEPFELEGLARWRLQDELIAAQCEAVDGGRERGAALETELARIARRGVLAPGVFAGLMRDQLAEPMADLFERRAKLLAAWPEPCPPQPFALEWQDSKDAQDAQDGEGAHLLLEDRIEGVRMNGAARVRIVLDSAALITSSSGARGHYRYERLLRPWVTHLAAQISLGPLTTHVVGKDATARLAPLAEAEARDHLNTLCALWVAGLRRPLPLVPRIGFAWLAGRAKNDSDKRAREAFEGTEYKPGEGITNAALARVWPDYDTLRAEPDFEPLIATVLEPLQACVAAGKEGDA